jgi:hypothetical protein
MNALVRRPACIRPSRRSDSRWASRSPGRSCSRRCRSCFGQVRREYRARARREGACRRGARARRTGHERRPAAGADRHPATGHSEWDSARQRTSTTASVAGRPARPAPRLAAGSWPFLPDDAPPRSSALKGRRSSGARLTSDRRTSLRPTRQVPSSDWLRLPASMPMRRLLWAADPQRRVHAITAVAGTPAGRDGDASRRKQISASALVELGVSLASGAAATCSA